MKKYRKKDLVMAIPVLMLIIAFGISIPLIIVIGDKMEDSASKNLINAAYVIEDSVTLRIDNDMDSLLNFAQSGASIDAGSLEILRNSHGFLRVSLIDSSGLGFSCDGDQTSVSDIGIDNFVFGSGEAGISQCYYGSTGRKAVAFGAPVVTDGKITGAVYAERCIDDYYSGINFSFYEGAGRGYLVDVQTGEFLLKSLKTDGLATIVGNLFDNLEQSGNNGGIVSEIEDAMDDGRTGTAQVVYNENQSYICFTPVTGNKNWYLVTIIGQTDLMAESLMVRNMIIAMLIIVAAGVNGAFIMALVVVLRSRKEAEQRKRTELLEGITSTVEHAFAVYAPDKRIVEYVSGNFNRLFDVDIIRAGQDVNYLFDWLGIPEGDSYRAQFTAGILKEHYIREHEITVRGQKRWAKCEVSPGRDGKYVAVITDVTQDKEYAKTLGIAMENAERASRAKGDFLSNMSHDIRTPMNGIIGMTAIAAANTGDEARVKDCLKKISEASAHLLNLINEVLDMSKIESGKASLNNVEFNLADFMYNLIEINRVAMDRKNQELSVHINGVQHEHVTADQVKLQQIMTNIVSNANKYTPEGGRIEIDLTEKQGNLKDYGCYEFVCRDTGIGMDGEFLKKLFEPFERARDPAMRNVQGTGLGMSIVKNIVELMGGIIKVTSAPGEGTAITVIINLQIEKEEKWEPLPSLPVLVVDDEEMCCINTVRLLEEAGMAGEWVLTGKEGVEKCVQAHKRSEDYFAVILDWKMPDMDGIETARQIRSRVGEDVTIIILTAYNYEQIEAEAREAGVTEFLVKPLFKSRLYDKMRHLALKNEEETADIRLTASTAHFAGKKILLVEDNELNMEIAVNILEFTEAEIDSAFDGAQALKRYVEKPEGYYDLVLMDIQMPIMNGYETTRAIRSSGRHDALTLPIIAMTANAFLEDRVKAQEAGMNGYIAKPIDLQALIAALEEQLTDGKGK